MKYFTRSLARSWIAQLAAHMDSVYTHPAEPHDEKVIIHRGHRPALARRRKAGKK